MYNVREEHEGARDRLVAILDGDKVHVFCHTTSAAQGLALWQAIERLVQENQQAYKQSLKDIEKFLRRKSNRRVFRIKSSGLEVNVFADTASAVVDVMNHLQDKIKELDLSKEKKYLKKLRNKKSEIARKRALSVRSQADNESQSVNSGGLFTSTY